MNDLFFAVNKYPGFHILDSIEVKKSGKGGRKNKKSTKFFSYMTQKDYTPNQFNQTFTPVDRRIGDQDIIDFLKENTLGNYQVQLKINGYLQSKYRILSNLVTLSFVTVEVSKTRKRVEYDFNYAIAGIGDNTYADFTKEDFQLLLAMNGRSRSNIYNKLIDKINVL